MNDLYMRCGRVLRVVDGDTLDIEIDLGWSLKFTERVRLAEVDTPEARGPERAEGMKATAFVQGWVDRNEGECLIHSTEYARGKYGRTIAVVYPRGGGVSLNDLLVKHGFAKT